VLRTVLWLLSAAGLLAWQLAAAGPADARAGALDPSFGGGGKVTTDFAGSFDQAFGLVVQADGKLVAAGSAGIAVGQVTTSDFGLARYKQQDGLLDKSFGSRGKVTTDFVGDGDQANALVVQADGKLVAAGYAFTGGGSNPNFALARYHPDGTLDASFGTAGKVTTDFVASFDQANALVVQPDGKLVAAGITLSGTGSDFALARYQPDGTLDASFGTAGKVTTDFGGGDQANALVVQPDGKLVAAGITAAASFDFALARYNPDGTLDASFGTAGKVTTDFGGGSADRATALVVQADGRLAVGGSIQTASIADFALARYQPDGTLDASFGIGGRVTTDIGGGTDGANALVVQTGKLVAFGRAAVGPSFDFALARYQPDGTLDTGFGTGGKVTTDFTGANGAERAGALAQQADGKLVAAGAAVTSSNSDFALARYRAR